MQGICLVPAHSDGGEEKNVPNIRMKNNVPGMKGQCIGPGLRDDIDVVSYRLCKART